MSRYSLQKPLFGLDCDIHRMLVLCTNTYPKQAFGSLLSRTPINIILEKRSGTSIQEKESLYQLLKRPELKLDDFRTFVDFNIFSDERENDLMKEVREQVEIEIKYEGYFKRQYEQVSKFKKMEDKLIPSKLNYEKIQSLSRESMEKLKRIKPRSVGQASRIAGVSPADISVLLIALKRRGF